MEPSPITETELGFFAVLAQFSSQLISNVLRRLWIWVWWDFRNCFILYNLDSSFFNHRRPLPALNLGSRLSGHHVEFPWIPMLGLAFLTMEDLYPSCYLGPASEGCRSALREDPGYTQVSVSALLHGPGFLKLLLCTQWRPGVAGGDVSQFFCLVPTLWQTHDGFRLILWLGHLQILLCLFRTHVSLKYPLKFPLVSPSSVADVSFPTALPLFSLLSRACHF